MLADTYTPVGVYARLREHFPVSCLLESSDYHTSENSRSFICADPIASIVLTSDSVHLLISGQPVKNISLKQGVSVAEVTDNLLRSFQRKEPLAAVAYDGFFGYTCYDAVQHFEAIQFKGNSAQDIPLLQYHMFRYVLVFNHFSEELFVFSNNLNGPAENPALIQDIIRNKNFRPYPFRAEKKVKADMTDETFLDRVRQGQRHCQRGDVFQVVLSRRFSQSFEGDDFNVYRALRSINPSPYLFYFDFGSFRIFGSSPEAQLIIKNNKAYINPIAGTFRRTGNDEEDRQLAARLLQDPKENAEHVMLVDLARNDLSVYCRNVQVERFREIQFYSHVIHLVSTVSGELAEGAMAFELFSKTFPAGTLTGAPKIRAMQIIDSCEPQLRGYYGGALGMIGLDGSMNQAITIRSFLSCKNTLFYQAGAGVVIDSEPEAELQEVHNKLGALRKAIEEAENIAL
ncbi:MAG: anthranilate synthase component I [Chitinophagales bacterium]|nr:MAG: anthranilate synthase component I [Chitinophagales bacterium]